MRVQIVRFNLQDLSHEEYAAMCRELAPLFSQVPGLISKTWLEDPDNNTYGGVYTWESEDAMAAFARSELFQQVATNPHFANLTATDFGLLEKPTRVTRGILATAA